MKQRPSVLAVDDEVRGVELVRRILRKTADVSTAASGEEAAELLENRRFDLVISDQRMPGMSGIELLTRLANRVPGTGRVLLTAYADTEVAIRGINEIQLDYYVTKPWEPPEANLYPVLDDLLDDWWATFRPQHGGVRVVGIPVTPESHRVRDFLARNQVPYEFLAAGSEAQLASVLGSAHLLWRHSAPWTNRPLDTNSSSC